MDTQRQCDVQDSSSKAAWS